MHYKKGTGFLIKLIHDCIRRDANCELKNMDLTLSQMRILAYLHSHKNKTVSQKNIENYLAVSHPTVVGLLKRLEVKGFVTTSFSLDDKRMKNIYLTGKDQELKEAMEKHRDKTEAKLLNGFTQEEKILLSMLLEKAYNNVK